MKRIFTHLFVAVLLMLSATSWAQKNYTVDTKNGNYSSTSGNYCYQWTSNSENHPQTTISVSGNVNNLYAKTTTQFEMAPGQTGSSTWNLTVDDDYKILSYSFKYKLKDSSKSIKITVNGVDYPAAASENTLSVSDVNSHTTSYVLSGDNSHLIVTELTFTVTPILEVGQVYMFKNARPDTDRSLSADGTNDVHTKTTDVNDTKQQWYVTKDGDYYVLRNVACGRFLKGAPSAYTAWSLTEDYSANENRFSLLTSNSTLNTLKTKGSDNYGHMHDSNNGDNGGYEIVGWTNAGDAAGSHWTITKVNYTAEQIKALLDAAPTAAEVEAYDDALAALFKDGACTELKDEYTSMSVEDIKADANYKALPAVLQNTVLKIKNNNWDEANAIDGKEGWGSVYAKKFRVQMYEPYSIENDITSYLRINAHSNMDNPTGLYANDGQKIYVMVDGEIQEGSELWLVHQKGFGATHSYGSDKYNNEYTRLQSGLNVIPFTVDAGVLWINYLVDTYNADGATIAEKFPENRKLSKYKPIKIHIEGGYINGYYNAIGDFRATDTGTEDLWGAVDNDDDWDYYKERAPLNGTDAPNRDFPLLGHRQTLLFPLGKQANDKGELENGLLHHLDNIAELPTTPNCYGGNGNTFGTFEDSYPGMGLNTSNGKINIMLEAWDRITYSEFATMGLVSTSTMDKMNEMYPRWTAQGTPAEIYNYGAATVNNETKTYLEFCQGVDYSEYFNHHACGVGAPSGYMSGGWRNCSYHYNTMESIIGKIASEAGPTWGPAHEIGHQNQAVFNLNGQTEVTNNFFSNVAVWYMGMGTSRVNGNDGSLESLLALFNNDETSQYLQLTQGNHIWALTHLYYRLWLYYHLAGNNTQFWPRLFELCRQVPLENGGQISGETSILRFYKHACDAAGEDLTEFFRAYGYLEVMDNVFVGDYSNAIYNVTQEQIDAAIAEVKEKNYPVNYAVLLINDGTDVTTPKHNGEDKRALWDVDKSGNPIYTAEFGSVNDFISGNVATSAYTATYNSDGTITMSGGEGGVGFLILNEKGEIVSFGNKSTFALGDDAKNALISGKATVVSVGTDNKSLEATVDLTAIKKEILSELMEKVRQYITVVDDTYTKVGYYKESAVSDLLVAFNAAQEVYNNGTAYEGVYEVLYAEYKKVLENQNPKVGIVHGAKYAIKSYSSGDYMTVGDDNKVKTTNSSKFPTTDDHLWVIEITGENKYRIRHAGKSLYLQSVEAGYSNDFTVGSSGTAAEYKIDEYQNLAGVFGFATIAAPSYYMDRHSANRVATWSGMTDNARWTITLADASAVSAQEDLAELEMLVAKTERLINEVSAGQSVTKGSALVLQTTNQSGAYYIWSNAPSSAEGPIANLVDGAKNNHFHTDFTSEPESGTHYLCVDLGAGNAMERFTFGHTTRSGADGDFPQSVDIYGSNDNVNFHPIASVGRMPQTEGIDWEYAGAISSVPYRYLRFNYHASRGYWHMAEFDIYPVTAVSASVKDAFQGITAQVLTDAYDKMLSGKALINSVSPASNDVTAKKDALKPAYEALLQQYNTILNEKLNTLSTLVTATNELIDEVGTIELAQPQKYDLTVDNLYCNDPHLVPNDVNHNDHSANYVEKLTDGDTNTYLHTDYSNSNSDGAAPHYLRVDLGENSQATAFLFTYKTRSNGANYPVEIVVEGSADANDGYVKICTLTGLVTGNTALYESPVISLSSNYRYIRLKVTKSSTGSNTYFVMSEFGFSTVGANNYAVNDSYERVVSYELFTSTYFTTVSSDKMRETATTSIQAGSPLVTIEMLEAQIADQTAAKAALQAAMESITIDKTALQQAYNDLSALYNEMADGEGNVDADYAPSALTNEKLAEVKTALDAAKDKLDNSNSQSEIDDAKTALQAQYDALLEIKNANVATTIDKSGLNTAIANANTLIAAIEAKCDGYYESVAGFGLAELSFALQNAETVVDRFYLTEEQYTEAFTLLNNCYTTTNAIASNDYSDREALATLKTDATELVNDVVAINDTETKIALQATDATAPYYIYCNAPGATNNYSGDNLGVAALLDVDDSGEPITSTFLHSSYVAGSHDDALDHYLRVDMGESNLLLFKFRYTPRIGNTGNAPLVMLIEGSNDCVNFEEITILTDMATTYKSGEITNGKAYRYIRFMVKDTHNHSAHDGHKFFAMSHFEMTACKTVTINQEYASPNLSVDVAANAYNELVDANALDTEHYLPSEVGTTAQAELQAAYDALNAAIALQNIPVILTTDVNNPVLYKIKIKSNENVFTYDGQSGDASKNPILSVDALGNKYQAWYFMQGNNEDSNDDILILPYYHEGALNTTHKLGYPNINGSTKPAVSETGANSYNWYITFTENKTTEGWWNLQPQDGRSDNTYVNQQGGSGSTILSFWKSASNPNDNGSQFQFILDETDYSLSDAYYALYNQYVACGGKVTSGEVIGTYTVVSATAYNDAYNNAAALLEAKNSTDEVYNDARTALAGAYDALEYNSGLCKIRSAYTGGYSENNLVYVDAVNNPYFEDATDEDLSKYVWEFVPVKGGYHLKSLHTQSYITAAGWGEQVVLGDEAAARLVTVDFLDKENGIVRLNVAGGYPLHAQNSGSNLVGYTGGLGTASAWYVEEIKDLTTIKHTVTMNATFSSVMLGYNATVPAGVEAYNAEGVEDGYVSLVKIEGGVIPANTPVILYRTDDTKEKIFTYTEDDATNIPDKTVLGGSLYQKFVECDSDKDYYKLMIKDGVAKMYWMYKEFNAAGVSQGNTNDGGHIKCSANKIYMALPTVQGAASYGMRFVGGESTNILDFTGEQREDVIYDLQGRKLTEITHPGFYMVNGKKVYVK